MTLDELEKLSRDPLVTSDPITRQFAEALLAMLPVVKAAEAAQSACVDYGYCDQCFDHCGNCTAYGGHRDDCHANPEHISVAVAAMHKELHAITTARGGRL